MSWLIKNHPSNPPDGCKAIGPGWIYDTDTIKNFKSNRKFKKKYRGKHIVIAIIEDEKRK